MAEFETKGTHTRLTYWQCSHLSEAGNEFCSVFFPFLARLNPVCTSPATRTVMFPCHQMSPRGISLLHNGRLLIRLKLKQVTNQYPKPALLLDNQHFRAGLFATARHGSSLFKPSSGINMLGADLCPVILLISRTAPPTAKCPIHHVGILASVRSSRG